MCSEYSVDMERVKLFEFLIEEIVLRIKLVTGMYHASQPKRYRPENFRSMITNGGTFGSKNLRWRTTELVFSRKE